MYRLPNPQGTPDSRYTGPPWFTASTKRSFNFILRPPLLRFIVYIGRLFWIECVFDTSFWNATMHHFVLVSVIGFFLEILIALVACNLDDTDIYLILLQYQGFFINFLYKNILAMLIFFVWSNYNVNNNKYFNPWTPGTSYLPILTIIVSDIVAYQTLISRSFLYQTRFTLIMQCNSTKRLAQWRGVTFWTQRVPDSCPS